MKFVNVLGDILEKKNISLDQYFTTFTTSKKISDIFLKNRDIFCYNEAIA